jgi:hypothetical protein
LESALEEELTTKVRVLCETNKLWRRQRGWEMDVRSTFLLLLGERKGNDMIAKFKTLRSSLTITIISTSSFEWGNGRRKFIKVYFDFTILCFLEFFFLRFLLAFVSS